MKHAQQLGRYHLLDRIAFGGMAEIYRARTFDAQGRPHLVAVKRVLAHLAEDEDFIQMLVDEAKIASVLRHDNIARVYEFTRSHGEYFIAMEHVDGKDMRTVLERCRAKKRPIPPEHAAHICAEVGAALHLAHSATDSRGRPLQIIHRDVSPSNIICSYSGEVKLCDFGIAKATLSRVTTKTGVIKGKVKYMSPEQALGRKLDHRSDVFSLGSCLYEMLTRVPPFTASNEMDLLIKVRDAKYRPITALQPDVPQALETICDRCLTRSRANRYQTAAEAEADLRAFLQRFMPSYSRSHLGRFIRRMFAAEIERELRMLEEYVMTQDVSDDLGESLMRADDNFVPPEIPFQPKPTSVSVAPIDPWVGVASEFADNHLMTPTPVDLALHLPGNAASGASESSPMRNAPGRSLSGDDADSLGGADTVTVHSVNTQILVVDTHRSTEAATRPGRNPTPHPSTSPHGDPVDHPSDDDDDDLHGAPTKIIDLGRVPTRPPR